jgi:hypothetical protein
MRSILFPALVTTLFLVPSIHSAVNGPQPSAVPSKHNQADEVFLRWEGHAPLPFDEDNAEHCNRLVITANNNAQFGKCSEKPRTWQVSFDAIVRQFAPFEYRSSDVTLSFNGRGKVAGEVWQRAIAAWASYTFAEMYVGHACASCRNVLEWYFALIPNHVGYRGILLVLHHGYVMKMHEADDKIEAKIVAEGWLTTEEWTELDNWVQTLASQSIEGIGFLHGKGTKQMSPAELDALRQWARKVYDRLQQK